MEDFEDDEARVYDTLDFYDNGSMLDGHCRMKGTKEVWCKTDIGPRKKMAVLYNHIILHQATMSLSEIDKATYDLSKLKVCSKWHRNLKGDKARVYEAFHRERGACWYKQITLKNAGNTGTAVPNEGDTKRLRLRVVQLKSQADMAAAENERLREQVVQQANETAAVQNENEQLREHNAKMNFHDTSKHAPYAGVSTGSSNVHVKVEEGTEFTRRPSSTSTSSDTGMLTPPSTPSSPSEQNVDQSAKTIAELEYKVDVLELQVAEKTSIAAIAGTRADETEKLLGLMRAFTEKTNTKMMASF
ncbi:hypothetical protein LTR85_009734 [Meristemomyces frigidus]|nr:hypothetical protein LTR85_009734 [Meristemomyces frigidus]